MLPAVTLVFHVQAFSGAGTADNAGGTAAVCHLCDYCYISWHGKCLCLIYLGSNKALLLHAAPYVDQQTVSITITVMGMTMPRIRINHAIITVQTANSF